ncbi:multicopper oxidase-domain-containing protein [Lipomyces tetrasporus]
MLSNLLGLVFSGLALLVPPIVAQLQLHCHDELFIPDAILRVTAMNISKACLERYSVVINGSSPGPELRLRGDKTTWIRVYNDMDDKNLTMHWHGLSMAASPFSDGSPQASQWPIPPHHFFDYELHPEIGHAGTYFYHSHIGFQAVSASGPLIVEDHETVPYYYDGERIIHLSDLFEKTDSEIETGLTSIPFAWSGETSNVLVNGLGLPINAKVNSALSIVSAAFQGHNLTIIEADGSYTRPYDIDYLQVGSGQRLSALLQTKTHEELRLDRANGIYQYYLQLETRERPTTLRTYAVLTYPGGTNAVSTVPATTPLSLPNMTLGWMDYQLRPLKCTDFPTLAEVTRRVTVTVQQIVNNSITWAENGLPWTPKVPRAPYLVSLYEDKLPIQASYASFHAHGAHYYDIGSGNGTYNVTANEERLKGTEHVLRDTTMLYKYGQETTPVADAGWRAWRLRVTEAGVWMIHCHILQHMIMGMQTVWMFGDRDDILKLPYPTVQGYLTYGGDVYGNSTHWPNCVHYGDSRF